MFNTSTNKIFTLPRILRNYCYLSITFNHDHIITMCEPSIHILLPELADPSCPGYLFG